MLNEVEYNQVLELVKEKVKENPYDKEMRDLLISLENGKKKVLSYEERIKGNEIIDVFYKMGIYSSNDPGRITHKEIKKSVEYMVLINKYKKITENFTNLIHESNSLNKSDLEALIYENNQDVLGIGFCIGELIGSSSK